MTKHWEHGYYYPVELETDGNVKREWMDEIRSLREKLAACQEERDEAKNIANYWMDKHDSCKKDRDSIIEKCASLCDALWDKTGDDCAISIRALKNQSV